MKKCLLLLIALICVATSASATTLTQARKAHPTKLIKLDKAPQPFGPLRLPPDVREVSFQSGQLPLKAWISAPVKSNKPAPAVVFLHGGFSFGIDDWDAAKSLINAGYVVMMPRLRAENGNPGNFELFGGEVDDAIAAGQYLANMDGIDKNRIFVMGHSVGGSLTILVSQMDSPFRAGAALSGYARLLDWIDHFNRLEPFDKRDPLERNIRNPMLYAAQVKIPLYLFTESDNPYAATANEDFCATVAKTSPCKHQTIKGDHRSMIEPSIESAIVAFNGIK